MSFAELFHNLFAEQLVVLVAATLQLVAVGGQQPLERFAHDQERDRVGDVVVQLVRGGSGKPFPGEIDR